MTSTCCVVRWAVSKKETPCSSMHKSPINPLFALCLSSAWTLRVGQRLSSAPLDYISSVTGCWCDNCVWQKVNTLIVKMNHAVLTPELRHLFKTTFRCQDLLKYAYEPTNNHFSSSVVVAWFGAGIYRAAVAKRSSFPPRSSAHVSKRAHFTHLR